MPVLLELERASDALKQTLEEWGIRAPSINYGNMIADVGRFAMKEDADVAFPFGEDEILTLFRATARWFEGRVKLRARDRADQADALVFELVGPWGDMERATFQQQWQLVDDTAPADLTQDPPILTTFTPEYQSRVLLGQNAAGDPQTTAATLSEIIAHAVLCGANVQAGTIGLGAFNAPPFEAVDITCAEAFRQVMRWHPDASVSIDYTTSPPTLNVIERGNMGAVSFADGTKPLAGFEITPRDDMVPDEVVVLWEHVHEVDDGVSVRNYRGVKADVAPPGSDGLTLSGVVQMLQAKGANAGALTEDVRTREIPPDETAGGFGGRDAEWEELAKKWWLDHLPDLKEGGAVFGDLEIVEGTHKWAYDARETQTDINIEVGFFAGEEAVELGVGAEVEPGDLADLPNQLVEGTVHEWMQRDHAPYIIACKLRWAGAGTNEAAKALFGEALAPIDIRVSITATNARTGHYRGAGNFTPAEDIPLGLAQRILDASALQYEGSLLLREKDFGAAGKNARPGQVVNVTGSEAALATMNAMVQTSREDLFTGETAIDVGPAGQLGVDEWEELLRGSRIGEPARYSARERTGAELPEANTAGGDRGLGLPRDKIAAPRGDDCRFKVAPYWDGTDFKIRVGNGSIICPGPHHFADPDTVAPIITPELAGNAIDLPPNEFTVAAGTFSIYAKINLEAPGVQFWLNLGATTPTIEQTEAATPPVPPANFIHWPLAKVTLAEGPPVSITIEDTWCSDIPVYLVNPDDFEIDLVTEVEVDCVTETNGQGEEECGVEITVSKSTFTFPRWIRENALAAVATKCLCACNCSGSGGAPQALVDSINDVLAKKGKAPR